MKKYYFSLLPVFFVAALCMTFVSCGGGDDDEPSVKNQLVGIWKTTMSSSAWKLIELKSDGSVERNLYIENDTVKYSRTTTTTKNTHWIYNENDKTIRMYEDGNYYNYIYVVSMNNDGKSWNGSDPSTNKIYSFERVNYPVVEEKTPTYLEPTYPQHNAPQWKNAVDVVKPNEKYPTDLTTYIQLPGAIGAYSSNADEMAAFCGDECRGNGTLIDGVWCIKIWGNVGDKIALRFYCATNKYMYHSRETIVLKDNENLGTYDEPRLMGFDVDK